MDVFHRFLYFPIFVRDVGNDNITDEKWEGIFIFVPFLGKCLLAVALYYFIFFNNFLKGILFLALYSLAQAFNIMRKNLTP